MNTATNEVFIIGSAHIDKEEVEVLKQDPDITLIPENLAFAAKCVLKGQQRAHVSFNSGGRLSRWAGSMRRNQRGRKR